MKIKLIAAVAIIAALFTVAPAQTTTFEPPEAFELSYGTLYLGGNAYSVAAQKLGTVYNLLGLKIDLDLRAFQGMRLNDDNPGNDRMIAGMDLVYTGRLAENVTTFIGVAWKAEHGRTPLLGMTIGVSFFSQRF